MSFEVFDRFSGPVSLSDKPKILWKVYPLIARCTIHVPALCMARIPHKISIKTNEDHITQLVKVGDLLGQFNLILDSGPVFNGVEVWSYVFNISNSAVRIGEGTSISQLVSFRVD